jgi:hypothetical protein
MVDLEYVVASRSDGAVWYRLCWTGPGANGTPDSPPTCSDPKRSGVGRGEVGPRSGVGRGGLVHASCQVNGRKSGPVARKRRTRGGAGRRDIDVHVDVEAGGS